MSANYQIVTDRIITMLESGTAPWRKPWVDGRPPAGSPLLARPLRSCGTPYTGMNVINLWCAAEMRGFKSRHWMTYKTAASLGGQVRKGARSELAFYVGKTTVKDEGSDDERTISFLKAYCVFNADDIDGLPARFAADAAAPIAAPIVAERMPTVDSFAAHTGATLRHGGNRAFYSPAYDAVQMPEFGQFAEPAAYYGTLLHELAHWTSAPTRCNRELGKRFGDNAYAAEELVAELAAAFLCADLGVSAEPRADHASYLASWIGVLKADNRAIFKAASLAEAAAKFLHAAQPAEAGETAEAAEEMAMAA